MKMSGPAMNQAADDQVNNPLVLVGGIGQTQPGCFAPDDTSGG
jgi:hypothetical protein